MMRYSPPAIVSFSPWPGAVATILFPLFSI
jgi:hypothetical protein